MKEALGNSIIVDGDVLPRADDRDDIEALRSKEPDVDADLLGYAQRVAADRRKNIAENTELLPLKQDPVMEIVETAAHYEYKLRSLGVAARRIESLAHRPMSKELAKLQVDGVDTAKAYPPERPSASQLEENIADTAREARIEALMNGTGISYAEASRRI